MKIPKAVITAAGPNQHSLPLQNVVDRNGDIRTALQLIVEEAVLAGVRDICVIICPGDAPAYRKAAGEYASDLTFVEQDHPRGYGDALYRAANFVGNEAFLHLVGDHLYISQTQQGSAQQLVEIAQAESCSVSAVQATRENQLSMFGAIGGNRLSNRSGMYEVTRVIEKPTPTQAEQELIVAGLRSSHYLCMFGIHVLTPSVMEILKEDVDNDALEQVQLSPALARLADRERYLAAEIEGVRYNIGVKYGLLMSQLALALSGRDRDDILTQMLDLVATNREPLNV